MTALQLILLNGILAAGCGLLTYLITHGSKESKKDKDLKHNH
jgi:hypothetical protein